MSTRFLSAGELTAIDKWYVIDAANQVLGRVATKAATILTGKHRPHYAPFLVTGDHVVIINADKIRMTGQKVDQKVYRWHTLYPGGLRELEHVKFWNRSQRESSAKQSWECFPRTNCANAW